MHYSGSDRDALENATLEASGKQETTGQLCGTYRKSLDSMNAE